MTLTTWLSLAAICCLGAMSPGPSLAVVLRHTIGGGRTHGILTAVSHGTGVALWALLTVLGLSLLVTQTPLIYTAMTYAGACYLAWLGIKAIRSKGDNQLTPESTKGPLFNAALDGLMISLLNPKLAIFFIALFSQFVAINMSSGEQLTMIATAGSIDILWYVFIAMTMSHSCIIDRLQNKAVLINKISGIIMVALALRVVTL